MCGVSHPTDDGPRAARPEEVPDLIELANLVFRTSSGRTPTMGQEFPLLLSAGNCQDLYVTRVGGRLVSLVGVYRQTMVCDGLELPVACVGSVCTHPDYRGRGLAGKLTDLAIARARQQGCLLMPISGNRTLYSRRCAFQIAPTQVAQIGADQLNSGGAPRLAVRRYDDGDLPAVLSLHTKRTVRYAWTQETVGPVLKAHLDISSAAWVACDKDDQPAGFLLVLHRGPMVGRGPGVVNHVGAPETLGPLARAAIEQIPAESIQFAALPGEIESLAAIEAAGCPVETQTSGWTLRILDLAALCERLSGRFAGVAGVSIAPGHGSEGLIITVDGQRIELADAADVSAALFNGPQAWPEALTSLSCERQEVIGSVLPLPVPSYGLNFI
ncbi:MAG TPA: GNAT family N-acetyltransferase [Phycisphaerae bacterium]|nr:GNAT family N-acetyltransferase [Phycisphaerae bacterium]